MKTRRSGLTRLSPLVVIAIAAVSLVLVLGSWKLLRNPPGPARVERIRAGGRIVDSDHLVLANGYNRRMTAVDIERHGRPHRDNAQVEAGLPRSRKSATSGTVPAIERSRKSISSSLAPHSAG